MSRSRMPWFLCGVVVGVVGCKEAVAPPQGATARPSFTVVPLPPDTIGICLGAGSPSGSYSFSWVIQNTQPGDIFQDLSPTTAMLSPGDCLLPWRRLTPLPGGLIESIVVTEVATPPGVGLDSVEIQDRFGDHVVASATDTAQVDTLSGAALTFYQARGRGRHRRPRGH